LVKTNVFQPDCVLGEVVTKRVEKTFRAFYDKSMVDNRLDCYPFGYRGPFFAYGD
jgi:hypothetical protein